MTRSYIKSGKYTKEAQQAAEEEHQKNKTLKQKQTPKPRRFFKLSYISDLQPRKELIRQKKAIQDRIHLDPEDRWKLEYSNMKYHLSEDKLTAQIRVRTGWSRKYHLHVLVDSHDLEKLVKCSINSFRHGNTIELRVYAYIGKYDTSIARFLLEIYDPQVHIVYLNGDQLDNRRCNLQVSTTRKLPRPIIYNPTNIIYPRPFYGKDWPKNREEAMSRSGGICQRCRTSPAVHVHHRLPVRFFTNPNDANFQQNLLAVCKKCHKKEHDDIRKNLPLFNEMLRSWRLKSADLGV